MFAFVKPVIDDRSRPDVGIFHIRELGEVGLRVDFAEDFANGEAAESELDGDDEIFLKLVVEPAGGISAAGDSLDGVCDIAEVVGKSQGLIIGFLSFLGLFVGLAFDPREDQRRADGFVVAKVMRGLAEDEAVTDRRIFGD